jgi:hypothetical protein
LKIILTRFATAFVCFAIVFSTFLYQLLKNKEFLDLSQQNMIDVCICSFAIFLTYPRDSFVSSSFFRLSRVRVCHWIKRVIWSIWPWDGAKPNAKDRRKKRQ